MRKNLLLAAAALLIASPALASGNRGPSNSNGPTVTNNTTTNNVTNRGGRGGAGGNATVYSSNPSQANAVQDVRNTNTNFVGGGNLSGSVSGVGGSAAGGSVTMNTNVPSTQTIRTAPDVVAPAIWSNNPCIISASGSVSVVGFGASIGAGIEDPDCTRRANAQHLAAMGETAIAREVMCGNREVREAAQRAGRPCAADAVQVRSVRAVVTPMGEPVQAPAPVVQVAAPVPAYCLPAAGESAADRLMRQHNCR